MEQIEEIFIDAKRKMKIVVEKYYEKIKYLRTTIANPNELSNVFVNTYGSSMQLNSIANITVPEANQFLIKPYDPGTKKEIIKALNKTEKYNPIDEKNNIRIILQPITEEVRKKTVKELHKITEQFRVEIRIIRRNEIDNSKNLENINKDDLHYIKNEIQKISDSFIEKINQIQEEKEKDIVTI